MGKGTDKLYITHSEWSSTDAYSASAGSNVSQNNIQNSFKRLPFNFCAASLQPFRNPVCTSDGTVFDVEIISQWLSKHGTNPVTGKTLNGKDLIKLKFARNSDTGQKDGSAGTEEALGDMVDPVTFKVFTDNTHIVAIRHGSEANVFAWDTVERLNVKAKVWCDLVDDKEFTRSDIITLQDPQNVESRDLSTFNFLREGKTMPRKEQEQELESAGVNVAALGGVGEKVFKAREAVDRARKERQAGNPSRAQTASQSTNVAASKPSAKQERSVAYNAAQYTTGRAAASFTSTGLTPETSGERALLSDEDYMLKPKRVKIKGYARIETNLGSLSIEMQTETAPRAVWNFVQLSKKKFYNGVLFHRNIRSFMIQGGDPSGTGKGGQSIWGKNFQDEFDGPLTHDARGVLSMANKGKNTNSSQFFITYRPAKHLDRKHTIFGRVVGGMDVLDLLEKVSVDESNRPIDDIIMEKVVIFVDPFEEFQKQRRAQAQAEQVKAEIAKQGGTDDDRTTWTGKRILDDGAAAAFGTSATVGRYLRDLPEAPGGVGSVADDDVVEPLRKKVKVGGYGNFDGW